MGGVTSEQGYIDGERQCFWTWVDTECAWQSRPFKERQVKRRKRKGKGKGRGRSKTTGTAFSSDEQVQDPEWWSEEDFAWWSKGKKGKKGLSKSNDGFLKGGFRPSQPEKGASKDFHQNRRGKDQKGKRQGRKPILNPDFQSQKHPLKKDMARSGNQTIGLPVTGLTPDARWFCTKAHTAWMVTTPLNLANHPTHVVLDLGCTRSIGSRAASRSMHGIMASRRNFAVVTSLSCLPTPSRKPAKKISFFTFQQSHRVLPRLMCLRQVMCLFCFPR